MDLYFREKYLAKLREFYHETEIIKVITGVRRCGKSSFMQMIMKELLDLGIEKENIIYFNLDKRPYFEITTAKQLDKLIEKNINAEGKNICSLMKFKTSKTLNRYLMHGEKMATSPFL